MLRSLTRLALTCTSVLGLSLAVTTSAQAATTCDGYVCTRDSSGTIVGMITFVDDGDHFYVWDTHADGHGVRGYLMYGSILDSAYDGTGADGTIAHFQYDIQEGRTYDLKVCTVDGSGDTTPTNCTWRTITE